MGTVFESYDYSKEIHLNKLMNGDQTNNSVLAIYERDPELKRMRLELYLKEFDYRVSETIDKIFEDDIDSDRFQNIRTVLSFWDAIFSARNESFDIRPDDLFFALIVNWCASWQPSIQKIKSFSALYAAKQAAKDNGHNLDYRDYVINREYDEGFKGEYLKATIQPHGYNVPFTIEIPVQSAGGRLGKKAGLVKFCSDGVPGKMYSEKDPDKNIITINRRKLNELLLSGVMKFKKIAFVKQDSSKVKDYIKAEPKDIHDVLVEGDYETIARIEREGSYGIDFDPDNGQLILENVREGNLPSLDNKSAEFYGFCWQKIGQRKHQLRHNDFYVVSNNKNAFEVMMPR